MKQPLSAPAIFGTSAAVLFLSMLFLVPKAYPEAYIGAQIGSTIAGNSLSQISLTDFSPTGTMSERSLSRSLLGGFKLGYYFPRARWFGIETEAFYTTPNIKQQSTTISIQPGAILNGFGPVTGGQTTGTLTGDHFQVLTWAPVNFMFRYYKTRLQPYAGIGPGIFFGKITTTVPQFAGSQSSTALGLNAKAGLEYFFTRRITAFAEVKYNYVRFDFPANDNGGFGFKATYSPLTLAVGVSYHF